MDYPNVPASYRYILHTMTPIEMDRTATAWRCASCAIRSLRHSTSAFVTDRWTGEQWQVTQRHWGEFVIVRVHPQSETPHSMRLTNDRPDPSAGCGQSMPLFAPVPVTDPIPFGRGSTDDITEPATVERVEQFLREVRSA